MKYLLIATLLFCLPFISAAQKNNLFADIGTSSFPNSHPAFSITGNHRLTKNFGIGLGAQAYYAASTQPFNYPYPTKDIFKPAIYADFRAYFHLRKKGLIFLLADVGIAIYKDDGIPGILSAHNNGFYVGYGLGYSYAITPRGIGPYVCLKIASDGYAVQQYNPYTGEPNKLFEFEGVGIFALGFKF